MKKIYIVMQGDLDNKTEQYNFYRSTCFSSLKKAKESINNSFECNKGKNYKEVEEGSNKGRMYFDYNFVADYSCLSIDNKPMKIRHTITIKELY